MATQLREDLENSIRVSGPATAKAERGRSLLGGSKEGAWD